MRTQALLLCSVGAALGALATLGILNLNRASTAAQPPSAATAPGSSAVPQPAVPPSPREVRGETGPLPPVAPSGFTVPQASSAPSTGLTVPASPPVPANLTTITPTDQLPPSTSAAPAPSIRPQTAEPAPAPELTLTSPPSSTPPAPSSGFVMPPLPPMPSPANETTSLPSLPPGPPVAKQLAPVSPPPLPPTVENGIKTLQEIRVRKEALEKEETNLGMALKQRAEAQRRELQDLGVQLEALTNADRPENPSFWNLHSRLAADWKRGLEQKPTTTAAAPFQTMEDGIKKLREVKAKKKAVRQEEEEAFNTLNRRVKDQDRELEKLGVRPGDSE